MSENEIEFMIYFEQNLLDKTKASYDVINHASKIVNRTMNAICPTCSYNEYLTLKNIYGSWSPAWQEYKQSLIAPVITQKKTVVDDSPKNKK